jgi:hypothetical protein
LIFTRYGCLMALQPGSASLVKITHGSCAGLDGGQFPDWFQPIQ